MSESLPFPTSLEALPAAGFRLAGGGTLVSKDSEGRRGHARAVYVREAAESSAQQRVTLRFGNYLSKNMGRRRAVLAEKGQAVTVAEREARLLDRGALWPDELKQAEPPDVRELMWDDDGIYWFALAEGVDEEQLLSLGHRLRSGRIETPQAPELEA